MKVSANVAKVGKYSLKVINSLIHGGPYIAVNVGKKRVAWVSFRTKKHETYDGVSRGDLDAITDVEIWLQDSSNYNLAATKWNNFRNGVNVSLIEE
jgi:hypothetical protein